MKRLALLLPLLLAACGGLPQPFFANPGAGALRLAQPPPGRLVVLTPTNSLLDQADSSAWADDTAAALADQSYPASHAAPEPGDWTLTLAATVQGPSVIPRYTLSDSRRRPQGTVDGAPVPAQNWASGNAATFKAAAAEASPKIGDLLTRILAARLHDDPNSLQNRPARVYFKGVTGAPGDGNTSLAAQMRDKLAAQGIVVQDSRTGADYTLRCVARSEKAPGDQLKVELQWIVDDAKGERGKVVQLNEVPAASVNRYWGDVAVVAAGQAAGGIKEVLFNAAGPRLSDVGKKSQK